MLAQHNQVTPALDLAEPYQVSAQSHWYQKTQLPFNTTDLVHDLCITLERLKIPYRRGLPDATGLLTIDIALPDRKVRPQGTHVRTCDQKRGSELFRRCMMVGGT